MNISDCCGAPATETSEDLGICPACKEHCEFECDHNWKVIDDSFDHAFGTQYIPLYERCTLCGEEQSHEPYDRNED
jgi:hypothetical protein